MPPVFPPTDPLTAPSAILDVLLGANTLALSTHLRPDGDAIGSQLALAHFLQKQGKTVTLVNQDPAAHTLTWIDGAGAIQTFDPQDVALRAAIVSADVGVVLDTNSADRIGDAGKLYRQRRGPTVLIDHHTVPETWFTHVYRRESASSTAELVYELIATHDAASIDHAIASALYMGMLTDTGGFKYSNVSADVHRVVADLIERGGIEPHLIHEAIFDQRPVSSLHLLARALGTLEMRYDGKLGFQTLTRNMIEATGAESDGIEGLVNYPLSVAGVEVALLFSEVGAGYGTKVSFRSKGDAHVDAWARSFGGGGHRNASGAYLKGVSPKAAKRRVLGTAPDFLELARPQPDPRGPSNPVLDPEDAALLAKLMGGG